MNLSEQVDSIREEKRYISILIGRLDNKEDIEPLSSEEFKKAQELEGQMLHLINKENKVKLKMSDAKSVVGLLEGVYQNLHSRQIYTRQQVSIELEAIGKAYSDQQNEKDEECERKLNELRKDEQDSIERMTELLKDEEVAKEARRLIGEKREEEKTKDNFNSEKFNYFYSCIDTIEQKIRREKSEEKEQLEH